VCSAGLLVLSDSHVFTADIDILLASIDQLSRDY
jgi:hypothetical protein